MPADKMRVDKWLWCVRIFKSRSKAGDACRSGKVKAESQALKPAHLVGPGDVIEVRKDGFDLVFKVKALLKSRVSATLAEPCYDNLTSAEELNKYKDWFVGKGAPERRERGTGRPTKKERRELDDYKEDGWFLDALEEK